jgi:hypothetical protein
MKVGAMQVIPEPPETKPARIAARDGVHLGCCDPRHRRHEIDQGASRYPLGGVALKGCKIVQQPGHDASLATPSFKTEHRWQQIAELSKALREKAPEMVIRKA